MEVEKIKIDYSSVIYFDIKSSHCLVLYIKLQHPDHFIFLYSLFDFLKIKIKDKNLLK